MGRFFLKLAIPGMSLQAVRASLRGLAREVITAATFHHAAIYQHHHHHHHHHDWSWRVLSASRSFHPNWESPDWFMCLVQYFLVVPAVIDFKQWFKEFKEAYQWQRKQKWLFVQHDTHSHTGYITLYRGLPEILPSQQICHDSSLRVDVAMAVAPALGRSLIPPRKSRPRPDSFDGLWGHRLAAKTIAKTWRLQDLGQKPQQNIDNCWVLYVLKQQKGYIYIYTVYI